MNKYTFLLPAYKPDFLEEALLSIKNQTYRDFQVIVSDDCSPADLKQIFDNVVGNDCRFSFRKNAENLGHVSLVNHWNLLVQMCQTEFLIMASDDDVYDSNFLSEIDVLTSKYPEVSLFRARGRRIYRDGQDFWHDYVWQEKVPSLRFCYDMYSTYFLHCIANYVFRTDRMKSKGGFVDFPLAWFSDDATVLRESVDGVANTPNICFSFRFSQLNISDNLAETSDNAWNKYQACISFANWTSSFLKSFQSELKVSDRAYFKVACWGIKGKIEEQILACMPLLGYSQFRTVFKWLCDHQYAEGIIKKMQIVRIWIRGHH